MGMARPTSFARLSAADLRRELNRRRSTMAKALVRLDAEIRDCGGSSGGPTTRAG